MTLKTIRDEASEPPLDFKGLIFAAIMVVVLVYSVITAASVLKG